MIDKEEIYYHVWQIQRHIDWLVWQDGKYGNANDPDYEEPDYAYYVNIIAVLLSGTDAEKQKQIEDIREIFRKNGSDDKQQKLMDADRFHQECIHDIIQNYDFAKEPYTAMAGQITNTLVYWPGDYGHHSWLLTFERTDDGWRELITSRLITPNGREWETKLFDLLEKEAKDTKISCPPIIRPELKPIGNGVEMKDGETFADEDFLAELKNM